MNAALRKLRITKISDTLRELGIIETGIAANLQYLPVHQTGVRRPIPRRNRRRSESLSFIKFKNRGQKAGIQKWAGERSYLNLLVVLNVYEMRIVMLLMLEGIHFIL
jgi:hypothetical protein